MSMAVIVFLDSLYGMAYGIPIIEHLTENKFSYIIIISSELFYWLHIVLYKYLMFIK